MQRDEIYSVPRLAAELQVSATPVREALLDLAREGLLEPVRNRGFRVVALAPQELNDIYAIRLLLEVPSIAEVARSGGSPKQLQSLRRLASSIQQSAVSGDLIGFLDADRKFHVELIDIIGNKALSKIVAALRDRVRLYGFSDGKANEHLATSSAEHFQLLERVENRDADGAAAVMKHHLERSRDVWAANVQRSPPSPAMPEKQTSAAT